jgi:hypothetical protein
MRAIFSITVLFFSSFLPKLKPVNINDFSRIVSLLDFNRRPFKKAPCPFIAE